MAKLTEEEKAARAEARKAAKKAENAEVKETPKEDKKNEELELLKAQNEALQKQMKELMERMMTMQQPQVVTVSASTEKVHLLWQAEVADDCVVMFGDGRFGRITGKRGELLIPKNEFTSFKDSAVDYYLEKRWLIVLSGLTDEERVAYHVDYKDGEYLDKAAFSKIIEMGDEMLRIFPNLCEGNKLMVAQRYYEAYQNHSPYVKRENVVALNNMSKSAKNPRGYFMPIIESMNAEDEGIAL